MTTEGGSDLQDYEVRYVVSQCNVPDMPRAGYGTFNISTSSDRKAVDMAQEYLFQTFMPTTVTVTGLELKLADGWHEFNYQTRELEKESSAEPRFEPDYAHDTIYPSFTLVKSREPKRPTMPTLVY